MWRAYAELAGGAELIVPGVYSTPDQARELALADRPLGQVPVGARVERCPPCCACSFRTAIFGDYCSPCLDELEP